MAFADEKLVSLIEEIDFPDKQRKLKEKIKKASKTSGKRKDRSRSTSPIQIPTTLQPSHSDSGNSCITTALVHAPQEGQAQAQASLMQPSGSSQSPTQDQTPTDFSQFITWFQSTILATLDEALVRQSLSSIWGKKKRKRSPSPSSEDEVADVSPISPKESDSYSSSEEGAISDSQSASSEDTSKQPEEVKDLLKCFQP